jgi:hypothetical protein
MFGTGIGEIGNENMPTGVALSGNGFLALGSAAGMLRALDEGDYLDKVATISSVSGGSWFNTQFSFSKKFQDAVTADGDATSFATWFTTYQDTSLPGMLAGFSAAIPSWETAINGMYKAYDPALVTTPALGKNKKVNADVLICETFIGGSLLSDGKTISQIEDNGAKAINSIPAYWNSGGDEWVVPKYPGMATGKGDMKIVDGTKSYNDWSKILPTPTVAKLGSMSSAANGITANPALMAATVPNTPCASAVTGQACPGLGTQAGVCSTAGTQCSFPAIKAMDGCYSDNTGLALNIGHMQRKFPKAEKIRMISVDSNQCFRKTDPSCLIALTNSTFRSLFNDAPFSNIESEGWLPTRVPGPDRSIFAESITNLEALGQLTGYEGMTFVTGTFTTKKNDLFGVAPGTTVELLVMNSNGDTPLQGATTAEKAKLSAIAKGAYQSAKALLSALSKGSLDSSKAFAH